MKLSVGPLSALRGHSCCLVFSNGCFVYILFLMDCEWLGAVAQVDAVGT